MSRGSADLLLGRRDPQVIRAHVDAGQRHEGQVTADEAFLDRGELGSSVSTSTYTS